MSAVGPARHATTPPLVAGEQLDQPEFHRRYEAMPPGTTFELIDGVVFMSSPVSQDHGEAHVAAVVWLSYYVENTPGVRAFDNATAILGRRSEPQPDLALLIRPECGGQTTTDRGYVRGAPELVVEIAKASRDTDLRLKRADYERAGVVEYVVRAFDPDEVLWFRRVEGALAPLAPEADGLYRSEVFPGLWLDPAALLAGDTRRLRAVVAQGVTCPEHAAFITRLTAHRGTTP